MFGYFDESVIHIGGKKLLFLGFSVYKGKCKTDSIRPEVAKSLPELKHALEVKYSNVRDKKVKQRVLNRIKKDVNYFDYEFLEVTHERNIHMVVNLLILYLLFKFEKQNPISKLTLQVTYDKASYDINHKQIHNFFSWVKNFDFSNSKNDLGLQNADWLIGEASEEYRENNH